MRLRVRTIDRAVMGELLFSFLISLVSFNFVLMMEKLLRLTRLLSSVGASGMDMIEIILLIQPALFIFTTPLSLLIAVLFTYGRLNMDSELAAMRAAGMSFGEIAAPVRYFGIACFVLTAAFSFYIAPSGSARLSAAVSRVIAERAPYAVEEGTFGTLFPGLVIHVGGKPSHDTMREVFIYDERNPKEPKAMFAERGRIYGGGEHPAFELEDGSVHIAKGGVSTEMSFKKYNFTMALTPSDTARKRSELTPLELLLEARENKRESLLAYTEFHRRLTFPFLCLVIALLGPPLSLIAGKAGKFGGLTIGLAVFAVYYAGLIYGERLAMAGTVPHYVGGWAPIATIAAASYAAFRQAGTR